MDQHRHLNHTPDLSAKTSSICHWIHLWRHERTSSPRPKKRHVLFKSSTTSPGQWSLALLELVRSGVEHNRSTTLCKRVREMLNGRHQSERIWSDELVRSRSRVTAISPSQVAVRSTSTASLGRKRVCCSSEATRGYTQNNIHPFAGPGMWEGILN
jgi:hypothetical protein